MGVISIEQATEQDAASILDLRHSLEEWLEVKGVEQWGRGEVGLADVQRQVAANEWHVLRSPTGNLRAALRLLWSDAPVWQQQNAFAAYVHGLMVRRAEAGLGLGAALLAWAEQQAHAKAAPLLRLDCVESNEALRRYYRALGFSEVGRRDFDGPWYSAVLLESYWRRDSRSTRRWRYARKDVPLPAPGPGDEHRRPRLLGARSSRRRPVHLLLAEGRHRPFGLRAAEAARAGGDLRSRRRNGRQGVPNEEHSAG